MSNETTALDVQRSPILQTNRLVEDSSLPQIGQTENQNTLQETQIPNPGQPPAPEYRMPPLYGDEQGQGQTQHGTNLQTHSSKFPVSFFHQFLFILSI